MDSKYCFACYQKRPLSSFAKNGSTGRLLACCGPCRTSKAKSDVKRKALQLLDPNIPPPKRRAAAYTRSKSTIPPPNPPESRPEVTISPNLPESRPETLIRVPAPPLTQPQTLGFLPADQWQFIQNFHAAMDKVKIETCIQCKA
jgi:hypothetical protein